jgi:hypothetical protein
MAENQSHGKDLPSLANELPADVFLIRASGYVIMHARPVIIASEMGRN